MFKKYLLTAAMSVFAATGPAMAAQQPVVVTLSVQHLRYHTSRPYPAVKADLEQKLSRLDAHIRSLLADGKTDELRTALEKASGRYGLVIHYVALHGNWLVLNGGRKNGIVYHIGNVLTAVQMTRENFGAGLYAPLRLAVYDDGAGQRSNTTSHPACLDSSTTRRSTSKPPVWTNGWSTSSRTSATAAPRRKDQRRNDKLRRSEIPVRI